MMFCLPEESLFYSWQARLFLTEIFWHWVAGRKWIF